MKKRIVIEIEHPDCDTINITQADLMTIQNEVLNQLCIVEEVAEGRYEIDAKVTEPIDEKKLDELAYSHILAIVKTENIIESINILLDEYKEWECFRRKY